MRCWHPGYYGVADVMLRGTSEELGGRHESLVQVCRSDRVYIGRLLRDGGAGICSPV
jgi:hypothetical protein